MDSAKQAIRWGIPGWLFFLFFFINHTFFLYVYNLTIKKDISFNFSAIISSYKIDFSSILIIVGILGIPIGYIIYQFYFIISRSFAKEISELCNFKKGDDNIITKSKKLLKKLNIEETKNNKNLKRIDSEGILPYLFKNFSQWIYRRLSNLFSFRKTKAVTKRTHQIDLLEIKWAQVDCLLRKKILSNDKLVNGYDEIIKRDNHLSDMIHSLGAASYAALLSLFFYASNLTKNLILNFHFYKNAEWKFIGIFFICYLVPAIITTSFIFVAKQNARKTTIHKIAFLTEFINHK
jgi:hypothetical protein